MTRLALSCGTRVFMTELPGIWTEAGAGARAILQSHFASDIGAGAMPAGPAPDVSAESDVHAHDRSPLETVLQVRQLDEPVVRASVQPMVSLLVRFANGGYAGLVPCGAGQAAGCWPGAVCSSCRGGRLQRPSAISATSAVPATTAGSP
jgi:hypothetical protein